MTDMTKTENIWDDMTGLAAYDLLSTAIFVAGSDGCVQYANRAFYALFRPHELAIRNDIPAYDLDNFIGVPLEAGQHVRVDQVAFLVVGHQQLGLGVVHGQRPEGIGRWQLVLGEMHGVAVACTVGRLALAECAVRL